MEFFFPYALHKKISQIIVNFEDLFPYPLRKGKKTKKIYLTFSNTEKSNPNVI